MKKIKRFFFRSRRMFWRKQVTWRKTIFNMADRILALCNVACSSRIMTLISPGGSTLQCDTWLWDDMPLNSPKRPPYWNLTSGFWFRPHHRSRHVILHQSPKFYPNRTTLGRKKWRHVDFQDGGFQPSWMLGFFEKTNYITLHSYGVNRHHSSKLLSFPQNRVFAFWRQDPRWRISVILDFRGPVMGSLKSPCTTSYRSSTDTVALTCLVFEKNRVFFAFWRQTV